MSHDAVDVKGDAAPVRGWGKINAKQAFVILALDLDRAIGFAGFSRNETAFLQQVREACWAEAIRLGKKRDGAWPEALGCRINLTALAAATGIQRQQWSVARKGLIASGILVEDEDKTIRINKQADEWVQPSTGKARLTPKLIAFCRAVQPDDPGAAQAKFDFTRERVNPRARHQTTVIAGPVDLEAPRRNPDGDRAGSQTVPGENPDGDRARSQTVTALEVRRSAAGPIEERPRGVLELRDEKRVGGEGQPPAPDSILVSGKAEPWTTPGEGEAYRAMAQARPVSSRAPRSEGVPGRATSRYVRGDSAALLDSLLVQFDRIDRSSGRRP